MKSTVDMGSLCCGARPIWFAGRAAVKHARGVPERQRVDSSSVGGHTLHPRRVVA
jgi:hypothetical protein